MCLRIKENELYFSYLCNRIQVEGGEYGSMDYMADYNNCAFLC